LGKLCSTPSGADAGGVYHGPAMKLLKTESPPTQTPARVRPKSIKPGLRALQACGEGFWECDLIAGSAWFNDWFYRKLDWPQDAKRSTLGDLQPALRPGAWDRLTGMFRDHLEKGFPFVSGEPKAFLTSLDHHGASS
jgi:hypothetical protein